MNVSKWDRAEFVFSGPKNGNPYTSVVCDGFFSIGGRTLQMPGFYDGDGVYKLRFMPDTEGEWTFTVRSNVPELNGQTGRFTCTKNRPENHGPVRVVNQFHLAYEDGTPYYEVGTTCYVWNHQPEALRKKTLETLKTAPFNKMRMCIFPKRYAFNENDPEVYPFQGSQETGFDLTRFNPVSWRILEECVDSLDALGIEADLILFHPYDRGRWGFDRMPREADDLYLRYCVARLAAFRGVWWSFANEFDFMLEKSEADWDHYGPYVQRLDPHGHLRSIHNGRMIYNHAKPWVTHCSIQSSDFARALEWAEDYRKPLIIDECCYEGNIPQLWGSINARAMTARFWEYLVRGAYCGHGETYYNDREELWWSKGGELTGESPARIRFYREILSSLSNDFTTFPGREMRSVIGSAGKWYLLYTGNRQSIWRELSLPEEGSYSIEIIDTWEMNRSMLPGTYSGVTRVDLPQNGELAVLCRRVD